MNAPDDRDDAPAGPPQDLAAAYHRASDADISRPSAATRANILALARREATANAARGQRVMPTAAANDSSWNWRAAAGFAGVAFAGVLALWMYREQPAPLATLQRVEESAVTSQADVAASAAPAATAAPTTTRRSPPVLESAPQGAAKVAARSNTPPPAALRSEAQQAVPSQAGETAPAALETVQAANTRSSPVAAQLSRSAAPALLADRAFVPDAEALLQRWYPQALDSEADGQQFWFVFDADGSVLHHGQRAWRDLSALQDTLRSTAAPRGIERVESVHHRNRRGHDVELAYAWVKAD